MGEGQALKNLLALAAIVLTISALAACGPKEPSPEEKLVSDAKAFVAAGLKDPESAKFRSLDVYVDKKIVCGEINGKNSYGAYSGFSPFYYKNGYGQITDYDSIFYPSYEEVCLGALRAEAAAALESAAEKEKLLRENY